MALIDQVESSAFSISPVLRLYFTDTAYGTITCYFSSISVVSGGGGVVGDFILTGPWGDPVVKSWGSFRTILNGSEGRSGVSEAQVELLTDGRISPQGAPGMHAIPEGWTVRTFFTNFNLRGSAVKLWAIDARSPAGAPDTLWEGTVVGFRSIRDENRILVTTLLLRSRWASEQIYVLKELSKENYSNLPPDQVGLGVPSAFGNFGIDLNVPIFHSGPSEAKCRAIYCGYRPTGVIGVPVNDKAGSGRVRYVFDRVEGSSPGWSDGGGDMGFGTLDRAYPTSASEYPGSFGVYLPDMNLYGVLRADPVTGGTGTLGDSYSFTPAELYADMGYGGNTVMAYLGVRPSVIYYPATHSAFQGDAGLKVIDDDPTNYIDTTSTDYTITFLCPSVPVPVGAEILSIIPCVEYGTVTSNDGITRTLRLGIWNERNKGGANWLGAYGGSGSRYNDITLASQANTKIDFYANIPSGWGFATDCKENDGSNTDQAFRAGQFYGLNSGDTTSTDFGIQLAVTSATKSGVRIYHVSMIAVIRLPIEVRSRVISMGYSKLRQYRFTKTYADDTARAFTVRGTLLKTATPTVETERLPAAGPIFFCFSNMKLDDGTYTGTDGDVIERVPEIIHYLIDNAGGEINTTAGTLGCVTDFRDWDTGRKTAIAIQFGPDPRHNLRSALELLMSRWPVSVNFFDNKYQVIPRGVILEGQVYRSKIRGTKDLLTQSLEVQEPDLDVIQNQQKLHYACGLGTDIAQKTVTADHPRSQKFFGVRPSQPIVEPWIRGKLAYTAADDAPAVYLAEYLASVDANPRQLVRALLTMRFFDLRPGHVLEFDTDMESIGLRCTAHRNGRLDYFFTRTDGAATDISEDPTPLLMISGGITSEITWGMNAQSDTLLISKPATGGYTTVANGYEYYNGSSWVALTGVTRSDGGDPLKAFSSDISGSFSVSYTRPAIHAWPKSIITIDDVKYGPSYWGRMKYASASATCTGTDFVRVLDRWNGRIFEVIEVALRMVGSKGRKQFPAIDTLLREVA